MRIELRRTGPRTVELELEDDWEESDWRGLCEGLWLEGWEPASSRQAGSEQLPYLTERVDWLEEQAETATGSERERLLTEIAELWIRRDTPYETRECLVAFLGPFLKPEARLAQAEAQNGRDVVRLLRVAREPLSMALGSMENSAAEFWKNGLPASETDFDRRLAAWLRNVVRGKRVDVLRDFCVVLESLPEEKLHEGVDPEELWESSTLTTEQGDGGPRNRLMNAFWDYVFRFGKLPHKGTILDDAEIHDSSNGSTYLQNLGLGGLPKRPPIRTR